MSNKKQLQQLERDAEQNGWSISHTNGGHLKWIFEKTGAFFFSSSTPSDPRTVKNVLSCMRRIEKCAAGV